MQDQAERDNNKENYMLSLINANVEVNHELNEASKSKALQLTKILAGEDDKIDFE